MVRRLANLRTFLAPALLAASLAGCRSHPRRPPPSSSDATNVIPPLPVTPPSSPAAASAVETRHDGLSSAPLLDAALSRDEEIRRVALSGLEPDHEGIKDVSSVIDPRKENVQPTNNPAFTSLASRKAPEAAVADEIKSEDLPARAVSLPTENQEMGEPIQDSAPAALETLVLLEGLKQAVAAISPGARSEGSSEVRTSSTEIKTSQASDALAITDLRLCSQVLGIGQFEPIDPRAIRTGEPVLLYAAIAGLMAEGINPIRTRVVLKVELKVEGRDEPVWSIRLRDERQATVPPPREGFLNTRLSFPGSLAPGPYRLRMAVIDEVAGREAEGFLDIALRR